MATVPREMLERWIAQTHNITESCQMVIIDKLATFNYSSYTDFINYSVDIVTSVCDVATAAEATNAACFYSEMKQAILGGELDLDIDTSTTYSAAATETAIRGKFAQELCKNKDPNKFINRCNERVSYEVNKTSAETILKNGEREGIKRYARVPTGAETCDFCIMLASRGFAYKSEESASHSHAHCDCRIVPEFIKGQSVEGYDPEKYYEQYRGNEARKAQQVRLSKSEYGKVTSAINDVYKAKYKGFNYGKICLGNYWYEFVIDGFNEYRFIKRGELE